MLNGIITEYNMIIDGFTLNIKPPLESERENDLYELNITYKSKEKVRIDSMSYKNVTSEKIAQVEEMLKDHTAYNATVDISKAILWIELAAETERIILAEK